MSHRPPPPPKTRPSPAAAGLAVGVLALGLYFLFWPVGIDPEPWRPPEAPDLEGSEAPGRRLAPIERLGLDGSTGPEAVAVDPEGRIGDGAPRAETVARTGGRPLGLAFDRRGRLLVADFERGLLAVGPDGAVELIADSAGGRPLGRTNGVSVAPDGTVYFTDASWAHPDGPALAPLVEHRPTGRLLAHVPATGRTTVLVDSLHFANGVAVDPGGAFLLVSETGAYRIRRVELRGERAGTTRIVRSNLPGFPDGISADTAGLFWLALAAPRSRVLDALMPRPFLRRILLRIPRALRVGPERRGIVMALDGEGRTVQTLHDRDGAYAPITSALRVGRDLYLGSDRERALGRFRLEGEGARRARPGPWRRLAAAPLADPVRSVQAAPIDTSGLGRGPRAEMRTRVEKTIFAVDVLAMRLRVDAATASRLDEAAGTRQWAPELADTLAALVFAARDAWATVEFHRGFDRKRMIEGIRRNIRGAVDAGMIDTSSYRAVTDSLPRWLRFLEGRGVQEGDTLHYRIRGDTVRVLYRDAGGRALADERQVSGLRREAILARYLAPGSDFREGLLRSLFPR